eukprot:SM000007S21009  [mRNA]  locus=s7:1320758:1321006:- [translate_table: standard]
MKRVDTVETTLGPTPQACRASQVSQRVAAKAALAYWEHNVDEGSRHCRECRVVQQAEQSLSDADIRSGINVIQSGGGRNCCM